MKKVVSLTNLSKKIGINGVKDISDENNNKNDGKLEFAIMFHKWVELLVQENMWRRQDIFVRR